MTTLVTTPSGTLVKPADLAGEAHRRVRMPGWRFGHLTARCLDVDQVAIEVLLLNTVLGETRILSAPLPAGVTDYPALTPHLPAAHWCERAMGEMFGIRAVGHPHWKSLRLHEAWPVGLCPLAGTAQATVPREPYQFLEVHGDGIHEIPVGPIHAGIIEPGHFRFSCLGEVIVNLEIRLGYQHRGIERHLTTRPWTHARFVAESASSDTAAGNALAHAVALEQILEVDVPPRAQVLRTIALEIERVANHVGDLGAISGDIGYSVGVSLFPPMRGQALALATLLTGNRRQRWFMRPGGVLRDLDDTRRWAMLRGLAELRTAIHQHVPLIVENPAVLERMDGIGRLSPGMAQDFGIVGPVGRASGSMYDARQAFPHGRYPAMAPTPARYETGDVLARVQVRVDEITASLALLEELLDTLPDSPIGVRVGETLPPLRVGIGIVEAWRGELIHWITTDATGAIARYAIKDPSLANWSGLAIATRGNLVADFPLCNKSFNLSYSGNDL